MQGASFSAAIRDDARRKEQHPSGIEIDFDLNHDLSPVEVKAFREMFFAHDLLVFRNQRLSMERQKRVVEYVSAVLPKAGTGYLAPDDGVLNTMRLDYHSDMSATPMPIDSVSLLALEIDGGESWTGFVSAKRAYAKLPGALKDKVDRLEARIVHSYADKTTRSYDIAEDALTYVRPVVQIHRFTGEKILYINESSAARIEGLDREDSEALLAELFTYIYDNGNHIRHHWSQGDFIFWDNISLQHCRPELDPKYKRRMQRVTGGRKSLREQVPEYNVTNFFGED